MWLENLVDEHAQNGIFIPYATASIVSNLRCSFSSNDFEKIPGGLFFMVIKYLISVLLSSPFTCGTLKMGVAFQ